MFLIVTRHWPDWIDITALAAFLLTVIALPLAGHWLMVVDIRRYLRALKGVLVRVTYCFPTLPAWARYHTPGCLHTLGLSFPCTAQDVKRAYRRLAERHHPDRGGDRKTFLALQQQLEHALQFVSEHEIGPIEPPNRPTP